MVELPLLPLELPLLPLELPMPLLEPELGDVGDGVVLGDVVLLPLVPPLAAPLPDLLKWASHSEREIEPSLFVSTDEKLGAELLALLLPDRPPLELLPLVPPAAAPPLEDVPEEPDMPEEPELLPDAAGEDDDVSLLELPELPEELCAMAALDSANSAAAVATLTSFRFNIGEILHRMKEKSCVLRGCKTRALDLSSDVSCVCRRRSMP